MDGMASMELSGTGAGTLFAALTAASAGIRGAAIEANGLEAEIYGSTARLEATKTGKASAPPSGAAFSWSLKRGETEEWKLSFSAAPAPGGAFAAAGGATCADGEIMAQGRDGMFEPSGKVRAFVAETLFPAMAPADAGEDTGSRRPSFLSRLFLLAILSIPVVGFIWMCIRLKWI